MKKLLSVLFTLCLLVGVFFAVNVQAASPEDSFWEWEVTDGGVVLTAYNGTQTDIYAPSTVEDDGVIYDVVGLGAGLFEGNTAINSVTLAEGISEIGDGAFEGATNLVCIVAPQSLTTVGDNAFKGCTSFNSVILYNGVTAIGENAFSGCAALTVYCNENSAAHTYAVENEIKYVLLGTETSYTTYYVGGVTYHIQNGQAVAQFFDGSVLDVVIPAEVNGYPVTELRQTFYNCNTLKSVQLPNTLKKITSYTFYYCKNLTNIEIPDGVTEIGSYAFDNCANLKTIKLPKSLKTISSSTFRYCGKLTYVEIPEGVTHINGHAFMSCSSIQYITIPKSVGFLGSNDPFFGLGNKAVFIIHENSFVDKRLNGYYNQRIVIPENTDYELYKLDGMTYLLLNGEATAIYYSGNAENVEIPSEVNGCPMTKVMGAFNGNTALKNVSLPDTLVEIGWKSFQGCTGLTNIDIPESVEIIGQYAFYECTGLKTLIIPKNVKSMSSIAPSKTLLVVTENSYAHAWAEQYWTTYYVVAEGENPEMIVVDGITYLGAGDEVAAIAFDRASADVVMPEKVGGYTVTSMLDIFKDCTSITSVVLPSKLEIIGYQAFYGCTKLTSVGIPDGLTEIGASAFYNCKALKSIEIPSSVTTIGNSAFFDCDALTSVTVPDSVTSIGSYTFALCDKLTTVKLSNGLTEISDTLFSNSNALSEIDIPDSVTSIGESAFENCTALTEITLPAGLTSIGSYAFSGCTGLTEIVLPTGLTTIGERAFTKCTGISEVTIPASVTSFEGAFLNCTGIVDVTICEGVKAIGNQAFYGCKSITEIILPDSVTTIGGAAFELCSNLMNVKIPDGITSIGARAFYGCTKMVEIELPYGITSVGQYMFAYCYSLATIEIPASVETIGENAFSNCTGLLTALVPGSVTKMYTTSFPTNTVLLVTENSYAHTFAVNNSLLYFTVGEDVSYEICAVDGVTYFVADGAATAISFDGSVTEVVIPETVNECPVTTIAAAFSGCTSITSVKLPSTLRTIDSKAFYNCTSLASVEISEGLTEIGAKAFRYCSALEVVVIPESVTSIAPATSETTPFEDNTILIVYGNSYAEKYANDNYFTSVVIAEGEDSQIQTYVIDGIKYLTSNGTAIVVSADSSVRDVVIPETVGGCTVKIIGNEAFYGSAMKTIELPRGLTKIGKQAFSGCDFSNIKIPENVTYIGSRAFGSCRNLTDIVIPEGVTKIESGTFSSCSSLNSVVIPGTVESIGYQAFAYCNNLSNIKIPVGVKEIGGAVFSYCGRLVSVEFSNTVKTIGGDVFYECNNLATVLVPDSVTKIVGTFPTRAVWLVYEGSYAHQYAVEHGSLYFILRKTANPEINYGASISGTVTYTDGTAVSGATVEILYDDGTVKQSVKTDSNGAYSFIYAEVGRYTVRATDSDGNTAGDTVSIKRMNAFDVFLTGETDLVLKKGHTVSGNASEAAKITLTDMSGNAFATIDSTDGVFAFENIPNGSYILKAESETGSAVVEITVFGEDLTGIELIIEAQSATITGEIAVEARDGTSSKKIWVAVELYNGDGVIISRTTTDADGKYTFENIPLGNYKIAAKASEMRPDKNHGHIRSHDLVGYANVDVTEANVYTVDIIVLREETEHLAKISGKVTANGVTQDCTVMLTAESGDEVAVYVTENNGKYTFTNIPDGMYCITAVTKVDGMGFTTVIVKDGVVTGNTDIKVVKADKIKFRESTLLELEECDSMEEARFYKEVIMSEKRFYDSLSDKEKKQLSKDWIDLLFRLIGLLEIDSVSTPDGVTVKGAESIISADEIESEETLEFVLGVTKIDAAEIDSDGINTEEEYIKQSIDNKGKGKGKKVVEYYDISLTKNGQEITNVRKHTDTTGKLTVTMEIPEKYRGHKHYSFIHVHNGESMTLVDIDDDPNTVTFEVDRFSTFALAYTDMELTEIIKLIGDANGDGKTNPLDLVYFVRYLANWDGYEGINVDVTALDLNSDGMITFDDSIILARCLAKWVGYDSLSVGN